MKFGKNDEKQNWCGDDFCDAAVQDKLFMNLFLHYYWLFIGYLMNKDIESDDYHYENLQWCFFLLNSACEPQIQGDITRANQTGGMGGMGGDSGGGQTVVEVMVPGNKVGLVIGKGGETIRQLQVGCRLMWVNCY